MSTRFPGRALALILLLGLCIPVSLYAQDTDFETSMAQARVFIKKGWYREAVKELRRAVTTPQGEKSYDAHILLAQACFREYDIGCAVSNAEKARGLARTPDERNGSQGVMDYLARNFGKVEFKAGDGELNEGYLELEPQEPIVDRDAKLYYKEKVIPLAEQRRSLPWIMYLPAVTYKLHGREFTVEGGKEIVVSAGFNAENSKPKPQKAPPPPDFEGLGIATQLRLGGGAVMGGSALGLSAAADLSVHKYFGSSLAAGLFAKLNYDLLGDVAPESPTASPALTYGAAVSYRLPFGRNLALVPAAGYSYGKGPTLSYADCVYSRLPSDPAKDGVVCGGEQLEGDGPIAATLATTAHGPLARIEAAFERRSESSVMGAYIGVQGQYLFSSLKSSEVTAQFTEGSSNLTEQVQVELATTPSLIRLELLAGFNMTF